MKRYADLVADALQRVREIMPWDLAERLAQQAPPLVLESACDWGYDETLPELAGARERPVVVVCRSGLRSVLAADVMQQMGFADVVSLKTGVRGWNDFEQPLVDGSGRPVDTDTAEPLLAARVRAEQLRPR